MGEPAGWSGVAIRCAFHTLQAYRMPRHRLTAVPAKVTTQARAGARPAGEGLRIPFGQTRGRRRLLPTGHASASASRSWLTTPTANVRTAGAATGRLRVRS